MSIKAEKVAEVLALPESDRAFLAHQLIASLDPQPDVDAEIEWREVIDRRSLEMESGMANCRPVDEAIKEIRNDLHARRQSS